MQMDVEDGHTLPRADQLLLSLSTPASFLPPKAPEHRGYSFDPTFTRLQLSRLPFSAALTDCDLKKGPVTCNLTFPFSFPQFKRVILQKLQASCTGSVTPLLSDSLEEELMLKNGVAEGIGRFVLMEQQWLLLLCRPYSGGEWNSLSTA